MPHGVRLCKRQHRVGRARAVEHDPHSAAAYPVRLLTLRPKPAAHLSKVAWQTSCGGGQGAGPHPAQTTSA